MPPHPTDLRALAGYAAFAATLLAPLRHYVGPLKRVTKAKVERDSFPLSTYPMFSADRRGRIIVPHVVGFSEAGERIIPHYRHFGTGGLNQVRKQISRAVRQGRAAEVAQRYADSLAAQQAAGRTRGGSQSAERRRREAEIAWVTVVRSRFVFDDYFDERVAPESEAEHAECVVGGTAVALNPAPLARSAQRGAR